MRFLLLLQCCLLFIFVNSQQCDWKIPVEHPHCTQVIEYKVNDNKQALATCLEHFPTNFVEGTHKTGQNKIECKVYRQFQCNFLHNSVSIFDKCYTFDKKEVTMKDYIKDRASYCKDVNDATVKGGIPVFLTMTQAKHIAMKAHREGISKIWVNVNKDGKTIEESGDMETGRLLYKEPFKLHEGHYWVGDELKVTSIDGKGKRQVPAPDAAKVEYLFFRSKTDHWNNLIQGSFERATQDSKASIVCEYQAKTVPNQEKYCNRLGDQGLLLNARYSRKDKRCLYTTLTHFPLEGTKTAIENFSGCKETPSAEQKAGLDDGTASFGDSTPLYEPLTQKNKGTYRVAAIKMDTAVTGGNEQFAQKIRKHCDPRPFKAHEIAEHRQPYATYNQFMEEGFAIRMKPDWEDGYPKDECSDFPTTGGKMDSNTLAVRQGKLIDVPVPVLLPAICSIQSNVDCELHKEICKTKETGKLCKNVDEWNPKTKLYAECSCPKYHKEHDGKCKWFGVVGAPRGHADAASSCGAIHQWNSNNWGNVKEAWATMEWFFNNEVHEAVVRNGCWMQFYAHPRDYHLPNVAITTKLTVGQHDIPYHEAGTLKGWSDGMSASGIDCQCDKQSAPLCDDTCLAAP